MPAITDGDRLHLGFLHIAATESGFVGGMLVTNRQGRPLEFQCTTPVRPNKTQEILYGPTLQPYIYSELLGKTLCERLAVKPGLIVTNQPALLELRRHVPYAVACLIEPGTERDLAAQTRQQVGRHQLRIHPEFSDDAETLAKVAKSIPHDADLIEPLERVQEALQETVRAGAVA